MHAWSNSISIILEFSFSAWSNSISVFFVGGMLRALRCIFLFYVDLFTNFSSMVISDLVFASVVCRPPDGSSVSPYRGHIKYYVYWRLFGLRVYRRLVGAVDFVYGDSSDYASFVVHEELFNRRVSLRLRRRFSWLYLYL